MAKAPVLKYDGSMRGCRFFRHFVLRGGSTGRY